ncbi:stress-related protein-like [Gossypium australe]|uniref:Stress-related protein-like n=1 Tax=Gossypium australe TaxID=47621 RepID=A0A5B6V053_9ROSI|nr:stress-related protein-like [Gossypium australe]
MSQWRNTTLFSLSSLLTTSCFSLKWPGRGPHDCLLIVQHSEEKGYAMATYLSLILADRIAKVFADDRRASTISSNVQLV